MGARVVRGWFSTLVVVTVAAIAVPPRAVARGANSSTGPLDVHRLTEMDGSQMFGGGDDGSATVCVPKTCTDLSYNCGMNGDGCGGTLDCGGCPSGQFCGGGGYSPVRRGHEPGVRRRRRRADERLHVQATCR